MEELPPLPSSKNSSRAPSRQSSSSVSDLTETNLYIRDFVRETSQRRNFTSAQLPILDDCQLSALSESGTILVPLSYSALNALSFITHQPDPITTQLGNIQAVVATLPTYLALASAITPINAALRDLSQRVTAPHPTQVPAPTRPPVPPTSTTTPSAPKLPPPRAKTCAPPQNMGSSSSFDPDIPRYDPDTRAFYSNP